VGVSSCDNGTCHCIDQGFPLELGCFFAAFHWRNRFPAQTGKIGLTIICYGVSFMINIALGLLTAAIVTLGMHFGLQVEALFITIPFGLICGFIVFFWQGRKVQGMMEALQTQMQKDLQAQKIDRAIETLKQGFAFKNRHIFVGSQLHSLIGSLYYIKKDHEKALEHLQQGFFKNFMGQCMMGAIYYKRKDYDNMKKIMDTTLSANKKESLVYGVYAWFMYQIKEKERAIEILQQGLGKIEGDEKLQANLALLQNNKKMKMKVYGDTWVQLMLDRPPRIMQEQPRHMRMSRKAMFKGR